MTVHWDAGMDWWNEVVTPAAVLPVTVAFIRDQVLRVVNGTAEDSVIERWIKTAVETVEDETGVVLTPQTMALHLTPMRGDEIVLPRWPVMGVTSFAYIDDAGAVQTWGGSPSPFIASGLGVGAKSKVRIRPAYGESWPCARPQADAVTVTYEAGYPLVGSPAAPSAPERFVSGIGLMVGEIYKQRSLSAEGLEPSVLQLRRFWRRAY